MPQTNKIKKEIETSILNIRGTRVILDTDLARFYGVSTKRLNEQVKRNRSRFPSDFLFRITKKEFKELVAKCDRFFTLKHSTVYPLAFTEYGAFMAANVLKSKRAVAMSLFVIRAFVQIKERISANQILEKRLAIIEKTLVEHDATLRELIIRIKPLLLPPAEIKKKRRIGFHHE